MRALNITNHWSNFLAQSTFLNEHTKLMNKIIKKVGHIATLWALKDTAKPLYASATIEAAQKGCSQPFLNKRSTTFILAN